MNMSEAPSDSERTRNQGDRQAARPERRLARARGVRGLRHRRRDERRDALRSARRRREEAPRATRRLAARRDRVLLGVPAPVGDEVVGPAGPTTATRMDKFTRQVLEATGLFGMIGLTNGMIKGNIDSVLTSTVADGNDKRSPSIILKAGIDKKLDNGLRLRGSASYYHNGSSAGSGLTLYGGDRTGSNYQNVMEKWVTSPLTANAAASASTAIAFSGRFNPGFSKKIDAIMVNGFAKYKGFELFGTYETAQGYAKSETKNRKASQYAVDAIYRLGATENVFLGVRYNGVTARLAGYTDDVKLDRIALAGGWFITKNTLLKVEYVSQQYKDFLKTDYRNGGKFSGVVVEAVVGF